MAYYETTVTAPKNTARASAVEQEIKLTSGILRRVMVVFPAGCAGLAHVQVFYNEDQFLPRGLGESLTGDNRIIERELNIRLNEAPYRMTLKVWNLDDRYPHTPIFGFEIVPPSENVVDVLRAIFARRLP